MSKDRDLTGQPPLRRSGRLEGDDALWAAAVRDVRKLGKPENKALPVPKRAQRSRVSENLQGYAAFDKQPGQQTGPPFGPNSGMIDRKTVERLRKGLIAIEATLDLHGYQAGQARQRLLGFIAQSADSGKRCVLVITGKGTPRAQAMAQFNDGPGLIKREFRLWLEDNAARAYVMAVTPARPKHGGEGAFYLYLRKTAGKPR